MRAQLIRTIHDSILALVPDEAHETAAIPCGKMMEGWLPDSPVPITVDADYGQDWAHLSALDLACVTSGHALGWTSRPAPAAHIAAGRFPLPRSRRRRRDGDGRARPVDVRRGLRRRGR